MSVTKQIKKVHNRKGGELKMDNKTNTCSMCGTAFNAQDEMMKHAQTTHPTSNTAPAGQQPAQAQEAIKCSTCGASFSTKAELENHAKEHQTA